MSSSDYTLDPPVYDYQESPVRSKFNELKEQFKKLAYTALGTFNAQPLWRRALLIFVGLTLKVLGILFIVYHEALLKLIVEYSDKWAQNPWSPLILIVLLFIISFPPMIGFSFTATAVGTLYGITFKGWFIIAIGSILGSVAAFTLFRYVLKSRAEHMINSNKRLHAFSSILRDSNSYWLLVLIRLCPFPYSVTNGALAGIPGVTILNFALGSIISSPKLVLYLFVGDKIKDIGKSKDTTTRIIDVASIIATFVFLALTGWILFIKTNQRLQELEAERAVREGNPIDDTIDDDSMNFDMEADDYNGTEADLDDGRRFISR